MIGRARTDALEAERSNLVALIVGLRCLAKPARERMVTTLTLRRTLTTRPGLARVERHAATSRHGGRL